MKKLLRFKGMLFLAAMLLGGVSAGAQIASLPVTENFEGGTSIFEGGAVLDDEKVGSKVLALNNTTATASFSPAYTLAKNEKVTFKFTAFQGWVSGDGIVATACIKNSESQDLVSYTYNFKECKVTDVAIGGTTVDGFEAFFAQSNYNNASSKGSGNQFGHGSQPFVGTEGYNPQVTLSISGAGVVEFNLQYTAANNQDINVSYSGTLPEGTTIDLGSFVLASTGSGNGFGIDNLSITTETEGNAEDPAIAGMKESLSQMVAQYEGLDLSGYTEESVAAFTKAIEDVKAEIANPNATEESLMAAYLALGAALQGLEEKPAVDEGSWELVGTAILEDPWVLPGLGIDQHKDENKWEVPLERNTENENLYRLVDPYHAESPAKAHNQSEEVGYIVFDVTDPDHVLFAPNTGVGFKNRTSDIAIKVNEVYAYNRLTHRYYYKEDGKKDLATVIADYGEVIPFTTFKDNVITLGSITVDGKTIYDACFGDSSDKTGYPDGFDWENGADMTGTITLKIGGAGDETAARRWDFTKWSDATVANLKADAALGTNEGWSDDEKNDGSNMDKTAGNCFWSINTADEIGGLSANKVLIDELKGLKFGANVNNRGLAIAVNYPEALSVYKGGSYLWLGGANKQFFTIPAVKGGSTIKMGVESHKTTDARGVDLLVNGTSIGEFKPTVYEEHTWTIAEGEAVDVVVDNTNGCHIYFIEVEQDQEALLAVATADLKTVIAAAEAIEDLSIYTAESAQALDSALVAAKAAEGTIEAQTEAAYALINAKAALEKKPTAVDPLEVTAELFYTWDGYGADAKAINPVEVESHYGETIGAGAMVLGTSTVDYLIYADLTGRTGLVIEGTPGTELRILMNRQESNNGPLVEKNVTIDENGTAEVDLTDLEYVHLNSIKTTWGMAGTGSVTKINAYINMPVKFTYKVKEVAGDIVFRTTEGKDVEGTAIKVPYRKYNAKDGQLYQKGVTSKEYNYSFTLTTAGQEEIIEYAAVDSVTNVVFIAEGEDIEGLTPITTGNAAIRSSNSAAGHANEDTEIVTLEAGVYTVHVVMYDKTKPNGEDFIFKAGEQEFAVTPSENFSEGEFEMELTAATALILGANSIAESGLDAIYIVRTGDVVGINTINAEAENGAIYNLQGQKVQKAQKGLYIINGKKVVIK